MARVTYVIVEHDGGWAYKVGDVLRPFQLTMQRWLLPAPPQRNSSSRAKRRASPGRTGPGKWHEELAKGDDRPTTDVEG